MSEHHSDNDRTPRRHAPGCLARALKAELSMRMISGLWSRIGGGWEQERIGGGWEQEEADGSDTDEVGSDKGCRAVSSPSFSPAPWSAKTYRHVPCTPILWPTHHLPPTAPKTPSRPAPHCSRWSSPSCPTAQAPRTSLQNSGNMHEWLKTLRLLSNSNARAGLEHAHRAVWSTTPVSGMGDSSGASHKQSDTRRPLHLLSLPFPHL